MSSNTKRKGFVISIFLISIMSISFIFSSSLINVENSRFLPNFSYLLDSEIKKPIIDNPFSLKSSGSDVIEGNGTNYETLIHLNISDQIISSDTSTNFSINTNGWNITKTDLLFTNVIQDPEIKVVSETPGFDTWLNELWAMGFNLTEDCTLQKIKLYLNIKKASDLTSGNDLIMYIFNSTPGKQPDNYFYSESFDLNNYFSPPYSDWVEIPLGSDVFLALNNTNNDTFFIVLGELVGCKIYWKNINELNYPTFKNMNGFDADNPNWAVGNLDLSLILIIETNQLLPSSVQMTVNGTAVNDLQLSNGTWGSNNYYIGPTVTFNVEANISVAFDVKWICSFINQTYSPTYFSADATNSIVDWNATVNGLYFPSNAYNKRINVTIPHSWNVTGVYYENNTEENWVNISSPPFKFVIFNVTANGSWFVDCNGTNWAGNIQIYNSTDLQEAYSYYMNDTLIINGTIYTVSPIQANLTIFDSNNNTIYTDQANIINEIVSFTPWQIIQNSTSNDTHYIQIFWTNGSEVGINVTSIFCINDPTNLSLTQGPSPGTVSLGDPVTAKIFYNDTYDDNGIANATIQSNWSLPSMSVIDRGNGTYSLTFQTSFASNRSYTVVVKAIKNGYDLATTIIEFNVTSLVALEPTELKIVGSIPYTGDPIFVNDTAKYIILNYTNLSNGTGITSASIMTDPDWSDPYFQAEDLSIVNASQKGLYKVLLDSTGTHANELHTVFFYATKSGYEPSSRNSSQFQIYSIPTAIQISGSENITKFEGETVDLSVLYEDDYHIGNPAIVNADVNWTINTSIPFTDSMQLNLVIYEGIINLPELEVPPGTYNVTIKAQAPDFQIISKNITLNVLPKWNTTIWIYNYTSSEIRVGKDVVIVAEIEFSNSSLNRENLELHFDIEYSNGFNLHESKITNSSGVQTLYINPIPEIDWINVTVLYTGTPQINANTSNYLINISSKYQTNLTINEEYLGTNIISGEQCNINITLEYINSGSWTAFANEIIDIILDYVNYADESLTLTTNNEGIASLVFTPPEQASSVIIYTQFLGNASFDSASNNSISLRITKHNLTIQLFNINPQEIMVGSPLAVSCKVTDETGLPVTNLEVEFIVFLGNPNLILYKQGATTDGDGIATGAILILEQFEALPFMSIGVKYKGDASIGATTTMWPLPVIPMTTMKYISRYFMEYIWLIIPAVGAVSTLTIYKTYNYLRNRGWKKKINHLFIITEGGSLIKEWQIGGVPLDSVLISGALSGISSITREMTKSIKKLTSIDHEDKKLIFSYGRFVISVMITEKYQPIMLKKLNHFVSNFESKYYYYLSTWDGNTKYFQDADDLLFDIFPFAIPETVQEKIKLYPDIIKKETKITELNIQAGQHVMDDRVALAINSYEEAAKMAIEIGDKERFQIFIISIKNLQERLSKFEMKHSTKIDIKTESKLKRTLSNNIQRIRKALKSSDFLTALNLTISNAKIYMDLGQYEIALELFDKLNEYGKKHQIRMKELKSSEKIVKCTNKIDSLKIKANKQVQNRQFLKAATTFNEAAFLALEINDRHTFQNLMAKVEKFRKTEEEAIFKRQKSKQLLILKKSIPKILAEAESAKLSGNYQKIIELYLKAANINQSLGNMENFMKYITLAKDFRAKLENSKKY
ncbi:MAG: tetratricopeptide repeat protein [Candidatus Helarchaeota archaeon]|nr:tetratricopeptide repeat protein [Candidatus Helarchaeota archaeon]